MVEPVQFGVYVIERLKDNQATPILTSSNVDPEFQDIGLGYPLRGRDINDIYYDYPNRQMVEMASNFVSFKRLVTTYGNSNILSFSNFISGDDTKYFSMVLKVPREMWSDILLGTVMGVRGALRADIFHRKQDIFNFNNALSSFVDVNSTGDDMIIKNIDTSGYTFSNMLAGWGSALGALLPRIARVNRRDLFDLEYNGVGNSAFLRLALPEGKDKLLEKDEPYSQVIKGALGDISNRYEFDLNKRIKREIDKVSPVLDHIQGVFSQARYEADPVPMLQNASKQFYSLIGESKGPVKIRSGDYSEKLQELPDELPEPLIFKNRAVRWLVTNVISRLLRRKELKVDG
jgi:hypothetical protein